MGNYTTSHYRRGTTGIRRTTVRRRRKQGPPEGLIIAALLAIGVIGVGAWYASNRQSPPPVANQEVEWTPSVVRTPETRTAQPATPPIATAVAPIAIQRPVEPVQAAPTAKKAISTPATTALPPVVAEATPDAPLVNQWVDDPASRHATAPAPTRIHEGWFNIQTTMPTLPTVRVDFRIPLGTTGRPLPTAADLVLIFPYPTEKAAISGIAKQLSDKYGFTTISIRFPGMGPKDKIDDTDKTQWYYWPESGSGAAWIHAIEKVNTIAGFPKRKAIAIGLSGGGSAAGIFADTHPEAIDAVANMAGRVFANVSVFRGPQLIMFGSNDYVREPILRHANDYPDTSKNLTVISFPPRWDSRGKNFLWQHQFRDNAEQFFFAWIVAVSDLRISNGGKMPEASTWPFVDSANHYPSASVQRLAALIPPSSQTVTQHNTEVITASTATDVLPKGVVIIDATGFEDDIEEIRRDAEFFSDSGWATIAVTLADKSLSETVNKILSMREYNQWSNLPRILIFDHGRNVSEFHRLNNRTIGTLLFRPSLTAAKTLSLISRSMNNHNLTIFGDAEWIRNRGANLDSAKVELKILSAKKLSEWHAQRCRLALAFATKCLANGK